MKPINESITLAQKIDRSLKNLPNPSAVLKSKSATMEIFHKVARHPDIFPQISSYASALGRLELNVGADNKSVQELFTGLFQRLKLRTVAKLAVSARDYGFAVLEVVEYGTLGGYTVPQKITACPPECFLFDRTGRLRLKDNTPDGIDVMQTYPGKFILLQNNETLLNPYGVGVLDVAYWLSVGLNGNFEFLMQFGEEDGRDKWIGTYPSGTKQEEIDALLDMMIQGRNNSVMVMVEGMKVDIQNNQGRSSTTSHYKDTDEILRRKVEKLWTGTDLTMQVDGKGGFASSESGLTIREDALQEGIALVEGAVCQIAQITAYLNNLPEIPTFTLQLPKSLSKTIAETDKIYYEMGLRPTETLFIKRGYAPDDFFIDPATAGTSGAVDFAADPEELAPLIGAFDALRTRLKKKDPQGLLI